MILRQDPYTILIRRMGCGFSVKRVRVLRLWLMFIKSCRMIWKRTIPNHGCLTKWASRSAITNNTVLVVRAHEQIPQRIGWEIYRCSNLWQSALRISPDREALFCGSLTPAQKRMLDRRRPSRRLVRSLSCMRFFGSRPVCG